MDNVTVSLTFAENCIFDYAGWMRKKLAKKMCSDGLDSDLVHFFPLPVDSWRKTSSTVNCNRRVENPNKTFSSGLISNARARPSKKPFVVWGDLDGFCDHHWLFPLFSTWSNWISVKYKPCLLLKFHIFHRLHTWNDKTDNWQFEVSNVRWFDAS